MEELEFDLHPSPEEVAAQEAYEYWASLEEAQTASNVTSSGINPEEITTYNVNLIADYLIANKPDVAINLLTTLSQKIVLKLAS